MLAPIYINGRFTAQPLSGVQRFAVEISRALGVLYPGRLMFLNPQNSTAAMAGARTIGRRSGHFWEQCELPRFKRDGILLNLGNTAPILSRRQIVVIHDAGVFRTPAAYAKSFRLWYRFLHAALAKTTTRIVTVSEFSKAELMEKLNLPAARISVICEGADHMAQITADATVLARHKLLPGRFVLAVGNLAAHKNLAALGLLADKLAGRGMRLAITGALGGGAFASITDPNLPKAALYLGRVSDAELKSLYMSAACFVFPSLYEGFGLPAAEAMACGCAVLAADIPALRETCGSAAIYFDPHCANDISSTVLRSLDHPDVLEQQRQVARARAQKMTWTQAAAQLGEIIHASA